MNVRYALEGLGLQHSVAAAAESQAADEVGAILEPIMNQTWASGLPENS